MRTESRIAYATGMLTTLAGVLGIATMICLLILVLLWLIDGALDSHLAKARAKCDEAVEALLYSKDLVEVTRAGIIVDQLNCDVRRRLP